MAGFAVLPLGFSTFEKSTLNYFFALASSRAPHWTLTDQLLLATVVLVSANSQVQIDAIRGVVASWQTVILVGDSDFGTGCLTLPRPLNLNGVLAALNRSSKSHHRHPASAKAYSDKPFDEINIIAA